ncbi:allophanate hydrolase [Coraliomargarita sinensis]|uniref:Allophanate hydrolase n=1 Tax=Coraliomargarita sinensis TaxID=2174842 RepID=A0A317ZJ38_9BACT|nr:allophanate hydrolase subunit 1 [Coraliomargarita sinensis]PXA04257.1 allophanate hydrolase [Coraliomargarita sinensis]
MDVALKAYGETGILAHDLSEGERAGLCNCLRGQMPGGCLEYVEGYDTVLFIFKEPLPVSELAAWLKTIDPNEAKQVGRAIVEIPVTYDGPDLKSVAKQIGLSIDQVVEMHCSSTYTVRMMGFAPGFPYLDGLDPRLHLPRRKVPRKRIDPGSVAIGGAHGGIYSVASPGGWHLLGRIDRALFDPEAAQGDAPDFEAVFFFTPGDRLRFKPVDCF